MSVLVMEPTLPFALKLNSLYSTSGGVGHTLISFVNSHITKCPGQALCEEPYCHYFSWFLNHHKICKKEDCDSCIKLKDWVGIHAESCKVPSGCPLEQLCQEVKKLQLKDRFRQRDTNISDIFHPRPNRTNSLDAESPGPVRPVGQDPSLAAGVNGHAAHMHRYNGVPNGVPSYSGEAAFTNGAPLPGVYLGRSFDPEDDDESPVLFNMQGYSGIDMPSPRKRHSRHDPSLAHVVVVEDKDKKKKQRSQPPEDSKSELPSAPELAQPGEPHPPKQQYLPNKSRSSPNDSNYYSQPPRPPPMDAPGHPYPPKQQHLPDSSQSLSSDIQPNLGQLSLQHDDAPPTTYDAYVRDAGTSGPMTFAPRDIIPENENGDFTSFIRHTSVSSRASLGLQPLRQKKATPTTSTAGGGSHTSDKQGPMSTDEQRSLIQQIISARKQQSIGEQSSGGGQSPELRSRDEGAGEKKSDPRLPSEVATGGRNSVSRLPREGATGGRNSVSRLPSEASFGDAAIHRLDSMLSTEFTPESSPESSLDHTHQSPPPRSHSSHTPTPGGEARPLKRRNSAQSNDSTRKPQRKTSNNKLKRMSNVSSIDLTEQPVAHKPIQRQQSEANKRIVPGALGTSITKRNTGHCSSDEDSDTEGCGLDDGSREARTESESDGHGVVRITSEDSHTEHIFEDEDLRCPIQRTASVSTSSNKMLFNRGSIGFDQLENIRRVRENYLRERIAKVSAPGVEGAPRGMRGSVSAPNVQRPLDTPLQRQHISHQFPTNTGKVPDETAPQHQFPTSNGEKLKVQDYTPSVTKSNGSSHQFPSNTKGKVPDDIATTKSTRLSFELSEISSTPSSLSPNTSGNASQYSSLGDSGLSEASGGCGQRRGHTPSNYQTMMFDGGVALSPGEQLHSIGHTSSLGHASSQSTLNEFNSMNQLSSSSGHSDVTLMSHDVSPMSHDPSPMSHDASHGHFSLQANSNGVFQPNLPSNRGHSLGNYNHHYDNHDHPHDNNDHSHDNGDRDTGDLDPHIFVTHWRRSLGSISSHTHQTSGSEESDVDTSMTSTQHPSHTTPPSSLVTWAELEKMAEHIDRIKEQYKDDIAMMKNKGKLMTQQNPQEVIKMKSWLAENKCVQMWMEGEDGHSSIDVRPLFPDKEQEFYDKMMEPVNEERVSEEDVNHREHLREYLLGQFCRQQVYREGTHWVRQTPLGKGGQATCYSILDRETNLALALKEEAENDKSLDEAYICLKLAHELNVSRNIAEYFGAAMLPNSNRANVVQLFMEIMPTCMQAYLYKTGPMCIADVHHYAFQLFDALEYLHNKERIIHCDVKPANLLLDHTAQRIKLADFGAAELLEEKRMSSDRIHGDLGAGTLCYNPPEHYSRQECSFALDSWQAGCCVLAMATGRRPWRYLFMDPLLHSNRQSFNKIKRSYGIAIGQEQNGHLVPGFLDSTLKKLLFGCLHSDPKLRLTAVECWQLLAYTEDMSEEQRVRVSEAIGYSSSTPLILQHSPFSSPTPLVDIFLGSFYPCTPVEGYNHSLYPGWLGSLPYRPGMTYGELEREVFAPAYPVLHHLGPLEMAVWHGSPQELFVATKPDQDYPPRVDLFCPVNRQLPVSPDRPVVLYRPLDFEPSHFQSLS